MKFIKKNINDFFISANMENFDNTLYFSDETYFKPDKIRKGTFSNYCISSKYEIKNPYFNFCHYYLYDILSDAIINNTVYSYYFFSYLIKSETWVSEEKSAKNKILELNKKIERIKSTKTQRGLGKSEKELLSAEAYYKEYFVKENVCLSRVETITYASKTPSNFFLFNNELYHCDTGKDQYRYTHEQLELLLKESVYKEDMKFNKLKKQIELYEKFSTEGDDLKKREPIPEEVRAEVWRRDEGKCVVCGSKEKLEFDHIIPFSKGGGNTVRNLQLLCESCNRKKSNKI